MGDGETIDAKQRSELVDRILDSEQFRRSPRLSAFLRFICEQKSAGHAGQLNEHCIGVHVFGRAEGYHVGEDSVVRSQARLLRKRLHEYFATTKVNEPVQLMVPKGAYVPRFMRSPSHEIAPVDLDTAHADGGPKTLEPTASAVHDPVAKPAFPRFTVRFLSMTGAAALVLLAAFFLGYRLWTHPQPAKDGDFWSTLLEAKREVVIVPSDSSLVLLEKMNDREVSLDDYINRRYLEKYGDGAAGRVKSNEMERSLAVSQYTNLADLNLALKLGQVAIADHAQVQIRYARNLSLEELRRSNAILIGGPRSNPWVELFAPNMDLAVGYDQLSHRNLVWNRKPRPGEQTQYVEEGRTTEHEAYGVIAYLPSLDGEGSTLLVEGTSKAGTEAAAEFLFDRNFTRLLQASITQHTIPSFELLLATSNLGGEPHGSRVVSLHLH